MKVSRNQYIDIVAFRQNNNLYQRDLAKILNVSRGYISIVEKGNSKLTDENVKFLIDNYGDYTLVPYYNRLLELAKELGSYEVFKLIPKTLLEKIKYGKEKITDKIADVICQNYPEVNRGWLLTGNEDIPTVKQPDKMDVLEEKMDKIISLLEDIKTISYYNGMVKRK